MSRLEFNVEHPFWYVLLCLFFGILYSYLLYSKNSTWNKKINLSLAAGRFLIVFTICFLLIDPFIKQIKNNIEKPFIVIAVDNSQSIQLTSDTNKLNAFLLKLNQFNENLKKNKILTDIEILNSETQTNNDLKKIKFNQNSTDLSGMLNRIRNNYTNRNLAGVALISDGIFNQGVSPNFLNYNFPVYTIGLGDTIPKKDINLKALYYNKISYLGNKFPIQVEIGHNGYAGKVVNVSLKQNNQLIETRNITLGNENQVQNIDFLIKANQKGIQHLMIEVTPQSGEFTIQNNYRDAFVEIIEGKEKILLMAFSPHPDIKALKAVIESNENYEFEYHIAGIGSPKQKKYDLVILHQIPDANNTAFAEVQKYINDDTPLLFIVGSQSSIGKLNTITSILKINAAFNQTDQITASYNRNFSIFEFNPEKASFLDRLPPVSVPFGDFKLNPNTQVILFQKVGNTLTDKPLLVVSNDKDRKSALFLGEGLWQWRLEEYNLTEKSEAFDELIMKLIQYLSSKEDKRKLRINTTSEQFTDNEQITFDVELYNDIYEKIYNQSIHLEIIDGKGKITPYVFTNAEGSSRFEINRLPKGVYKYNAYTKLGGKTERANGEFSVKTIQLEALNTTADFNLLRNLSRKNKGAFYNENQLDLLYKKITSNPPTEIIQSSEEILEIINLKWICFLIIVLLTFEWGFRKYSGAY